ncbi:MAG TPA: S-layer homology domain-containing protein, partial [Thermoanaerobacterales bacterium]|nr:S-layer homology domain-containing protein [Thermoanaerobacterales bacterium]
SDLKTLENNLLTLNEEGSLIIEYSEATKKLSINETKSIVALKGALNEFLPQDIALSDTETASLIQGTNAVLADLSSTDTNTLKNALKSLNYNITTIPKSDDPGTDPGDKPGGGGKGEPTTPDKPEVVIPKDPDKPVSVSIPSDSAKVTVTDGKTVVSFDDTTVSDILKLLEDAQKKADDKPLVLTFDFSTIGKVEDNVEVNLPANLIAQAFEAEAPITVTLKSIIIDIPVSAMNLDDAKDFNINAQTVEPNEALEGISGLDNMKTVGNAQEITITIDGKAANLNKKITIKFNIKGITTNIDKLGVYFVDTENGTLVFVGGKVDRATGTIKAELPHLSTYALLEYDKTFADIRYHWAKNFIESMASKHILDGKAQDKFAPEDSMTRAEFAKVIVQTLNLDIKTYRGIFEDISTGDWFADYVQTAFDNNLIQGKVAGKLFDPNGRITRQEMMTIIGRAMGEKAIRDANSILGYYKDADKVADFAKDFVALLIEKQLVGGYPDMTLRPEASISRAEAAKIIYGFYNY